MYFVADLHFLLFLLACNHHCLCLCLCVCKFLFCCLINNNSKTFLSHFFFRKRTGADPGEVKWVNFHPLFLSPLPFFFLLTQILIGSITLLQKLTPQFKILDPRLEENAVVISNTFALKTSKQNLSAPCFVF